MNICAFIHKEMLHVLRDRRMMLVVVLIPVVQMLLFGFAISTEVNDVRVAIAFDKYSNDVRQQTERLAHNPYITFVGRLSQSEIEPALRRGEADAVVVFSRNKSTGVVVDGSNPVTAQAGVGYIQQILAGETLREAAQIADTHYLYNPGLKPAYNFVPAIMGMIFMLVCALMTAVSIVREKETGTIEVLLASPARPIKIIVGKMVPFFLLSCIDLALILVIAKYALGVPMQGGVVPVVAVSLLYILLALALGLLVSTVTKTQMTAMLIAGMVMIVPVIMLSGMIFPIDNLPIVLREVSAIVPARWYIDAMRGLMVMGLGLNDVATDVAVLAIMTIILLTVALKNFNTRIG